MKKEQRVTFGNMTPCKKKPATTTKTATPVKTEVTAAGASIITSPNLAIPQTRFDDEVVVVPTPSNNKKSKADKKNKKKKSSIGGGSLEGVPSSPSGRRVVYQVETFLSPTLKSARIAEKYGSGKKKKTKTQVTQGGVNDLIATMGGLVIDDDDDDNRDGGANDEKRPAEATEEEEELRPRRSARLAATNVADSS